MARPRNEQPTPAELEILKVLWDREGQATVRDLLEVVNREAGSSPGLHIGHESDECHG